ncbi:MAG TPA: hypothetical protein VGI39_02570, partial [Polyangiaceae bacterium]
KVQVHAGDPGLEKRLSFTITEVYPAAKPTLAAPWHAPGGEWLFFDATTTDGAAFVFGLRAERKVDEGFAISLGDGVLGAKDRESGARFAASFATAFHVQRPPPPAAQGAPTALQVSVVKLAEDAVRSQGFGGTGGGWTATKLVAQPASGEEAEVFFNFNPVTKEGEFSEKDTDYNQPFATDLAAALRDGVVQ